MYYWDTMSHSEGRTVSVQFSGKDIKSSLSTLIIRCTEIYFTSSENMCIVHQFSTRLVEKCIAYQNVFFCLQLWF